MGNKMKKLLCSLLAAAMVVSSASALVFAAEGDTETTAAETTVTETVADDASTADMTDEEKEAEDTTAAEEPAAEATEAPAAEATEAPAAEATEAPAEASSGSSYDNDAYYQKALALCQSLGIISGYEDGSVRPDSKVTRAEMASIVLRMLATETFSKYQNTFSDMTDAHWAADQVQTAKEASVISGFTDGTFRPDEQVTYAQVIVMLVNALNYKEDADYYGGWQQGYIKEAGELDLLKNASGSADVATDRGVVIKMVYNALLCDYKEIRSFDEFGQPKYSTDKTLAEVKFDVIEEKGTLYGTAKTTIDADVQDGQIEILVDKETTPTFYDTKLTDLEDYIGQKVTFYYRENSGLTAEVVAVTYDASKSEVYEVEDLDNVESVTGFDTGAGEVKISKVSKAKKTTNDVKIVYNGKILDLDEVKKAGDDINELLLPEEGSIKLVKTDKNNDNYDVMFVDSYETLVVTSATDTKLIGKIQDPAKEVGETKTITYNLDDSEDRTITVKKAGNEIRLRNLKKDDVATVRASYSSEKNPSPELIDVVVTGESVTGSASGISKKMDKSYATINGDKYDVANVAAGDLQTGSQATFYLTQFGKIGYIDGISANKLKSGEKYGWIMAGYKRDGGDFVVKIMTTEGKAEEFKLAGTVDYWKPGSLEGNKSYTKAQLEAELKANLFDDDGQLITAVLPSIWETHTAGSGKAIGGHVKDPKAYRQKYTDAGADLGEGRVGWATNSTPIALVKYKTNGSGALTELYGAVNISNQPITFYDPDYCEKWSDATWNAILKDSSESVLDGASRKIDSIDDLKIAFGAQIQKVQTETYPEGVVIQGVQQPYYTKDQIANFDADNALVIDLGNNLRNGTLSSGLVKGYAFTEDVMEFTVPDNASKYNNESSYAVGNINVGTYNQRENGISFDAYVADGSGTTPGVVIKVTSDPDAAVNPFDFSTTDSYEAIVVDDIAFGVDDDDNEIYVINGYQKGNKVSVTTKRTSALGEVTGAETRAYQGDVIWEGDSGDSLVGVLHRGDVIYADNSGRMLRFINIEDVYNALKEGKRADYEKDRYTSGTRNSMYFGRVTGAEVDDIAWLSFASLKISMDMGNEMDVVDIDLSKNTLNAAVDFDDDMATVSDVIVYDENNTDEYDYAFGRMAPKGSLGEVIIFRVKNADAVNNAE